MAAPAGKRDAAGQEAPQPRCIVWLAPGRLAPRALLQGLAKRRVKAVLASDAPGVMRELAAEPTLAVIIAEPREQLRVDELCAAVRRYYPGTRLWRYEHEGDAGRPWLEVMNNGTADATASSGTPAPRTTPQPHAAPSPHAPDAPDAPDASRTAHAQGLNGVGGTGEEHASASGPEGVDGPARQPPPPLSSLTPEELEMLLGDAPDEGGASGTGRDAP